MTQLASGLIGVASNDKRRAALDTFANPIASNEAFVRTQLPTMQFLEQKKQNEFARDRATQELSYRDKALQLEEQGQVLRSKLIDNQVRNTEMQLNALQRAADDELAYKDDMPILTRALSDVATHEWSADPAFIRMKQEEVLPQLKSVKAQQQYLSAIQSSPAVQALKQNSDLKRTVALNRTNDYLGTMQEATNMGIAPESLGLPVDVLQVNFTDPSTFAKISQLKDEIRRVKTLRADEARAKDFSDWEQKTDYTGQQKEKEFVSREKATARRIFTNLEQKAQAELSNAFTSQVNKLREIIASRKTKPDVRAQAEQEMKALENEFQTNQKAIQYYWNVVKPQELFGEEATGSSVQNEGPVIETMPPE